MISGLGLQTEEKLHQRPPGQSLTQNCSNVSSHLTPHHCFVGERREAVISSQVLKYFYSQHREHLCYGWADSDIWARLYYGQWTTI